MIGMPVFCERKTAPGPSEYFGPRGPSGVMARSMPDSRSEVSSRIAVDPLRELDPRTDPMPRLAMTPARMSPSLLGLVSTETPFLEGCFAG